MENQLDSEENKRKIIKRKRSDNTRTARTLKLFELKYCATDERNQKVYWYECTICKGSFNGTKPGNLSKHIERVHPAEYQK